eukprot:TRINITY_DN32349_c0_g1_i1.p1 TRINITY_DN32349_c0_g1~~TRINITY_DN32349_c0_g1_i1.p1  ORF type:complete len:124 (+),score=22.10 TRINITY_DN32349_c0_g1_i1:176-547(+)
MCIRDRRRGSLRQSVPPPTITRSEAEEDAQKRSATAHGISGHSKSPVRLGPGMSPRQAFGEGPSLSLIHISEPTRLLSISYAVFCLKKKKQTNPQNINDTELIVLEYHHRILLLQEPDVMSYI